MTTAKSRTACRYYRFPLPPHPIAAEQARLLVRLALAEWARNDVTDNALVIVAELAANAVKLGDIFYLTLSCPDGNVLIEVSDSSEAAPERQRQSVDRVDGRGLLLVEGCSKDWGWRLDETGGKTIWALVGDLEAEPDTRTVKPRSAVRM
jgi:hypothetical protein